MRIVYISGASEMLMAKAVSHLATKTPGKESVAIESFANALRQVSNVDLTWIYLHVAITKAQIHNAIPSNS